MSLPQASSATQIYAHPSPSTTILPLLRAHLPYSYPLYQRIVFHLHHPTSSAATVLATFPPSAPPPSPSSSSSWLAAHADLSRHDETQVWLFSTLELPSSSPSSPSDLNIPTPTPTTATLDQLLALLRYMHTHLVPLLPVQKPADAPVVKKARRLPYSRSRVLFGTLHSAVRKLLPRVGIVGVTMPYLKYVFPKSCYHIPEGEVGAKMGEGEGKGEWRFGEMRREEDLGVVVDRTDVPTSVQTLSVLPSVALWHVGGEGEERLAGWAFLGFDASLSRLHVEPEWRGRGLGVEISRRLFRGMEGGEDGGWRVADVSESNVGSRRVMEKIGGKVMWEVYWVYVELEDIFGPVQIG